MYLWLYPFFNWESIFRKYLLKFKKAYEFHKESLQKAAYSDLKKLYCQAVCDYWGMGDITIRNDYYVMLLTGMLQKEIVYLSNDEEAAKILNGLLISKDEIESVAPIVSVIAMANQVRASERLRAALVDESILSETAVQDKEFNEFRKDFFLHLEMYGDRGTTELKLETKTFRQRPVSLISLILDFAKSDVNYEQLREQKATLCHQSETDLIRLLKGRYFLRKFYIRFLLKKARFFVVKRETGRFNRTRMYGFMRSIFMRFAEEWVSGGILRLADDIFFLTDEEILANFEKQDICHINDTITKRKVEWAGYQASAPVNRLFLRGNIKKNYIPQKKSISNAIFAESVMVVKRR